MAARMIFGSLIQINKLLMMMKLEKGSLYRDFWMNFSLSNNQINKIITINVRNVGNNVKISIFVHKNIIFLLAKAIRKYFLYEPPAILTIVLKRFIQKSARVSEKNNTSVEIQERINLDAYTLVKSKKKRALNKQFLYKLKRRS